LNIIYKSGLFKQLITAISILVILAAGIPTAFYWFYINPKVVETRYHEVMMNDVEFLAKRLDWLIGKSLEDVKYLSAAIKITEPSELAETAQTLDLFVNSSSIFTGGMVTDKNGIMRIFNSSPQGNIELKQENNLSDREYIRYPLTYKGQSYLSDVIVPAGSPSPVLFLSRAIEEDGQTSGVLVLSINLLNDKNIFQPLVQDFQASKEGNIYVVDGDGNIVYHSLKEMVGKKADPAILKKVAENRADITNSLISTNGDVAVAYWKLSNNKWSVIYEISNNKIYAMSNIQKAMSLMTLLLVLILGLLTSVFFAKVILRPLEKITYATEQVAAGDLSEQIEYKGQNDFSKVFDNFNIMTTKLRLQYKELENLSIHDYLTGLANRRYFEQQLEQEIERAVRLEHQSLLLILDIDDFKKINDKFGHLEGDKVIKALGAKLKEVLRDVDLPARFGGEEFIVLLPETSLEQGKRIAERIRSSMSEINISSRKGNIAFTISIGMTAIKKGEKTEEPSNMARRIIGRADKALYQAKSAGKNRVEVL
jgi:diguanylate cyclase (GGDEF)-like protein